MILPAVGPSTAANGSLLAQTFGYWIDNIVRDWRRSLLSGNAEHNRLVELEAMRRVTACYKAERHIVRDVSNLNLDWDLEARCGGKVSYIEVKGVTGPLPEFFLTPNEHRAASDQKGWVAVVITAIFGAEPAWYEFSGTEVTAAAQPTQFRVTPIP